MDKLRFELQSQSSKTTQILGRSSRFSTIHVGAGSESREYASGNHRFRFLQVTIRCYCIAKMMYLSFRRITRRCGSST